MRFRSIFSALICALILTSCTTVGDWVDMGGGGKATSSPSPSYPGTTVEKTIDDLKKAIIATHTALYVPAMEGLSIALAAGKISPSQEARIQAISEKYIAAKDRADAAIRAYSTGTSGVVQTEMSNMLAAVGELQGITK